MKYARSAPPGPHGGAAGDDEVARVRDAGQSARHRRGLLARKVYLRCQLKFSKYSENQPSLLFYEYCENFREVSLTALVTLNL